MRVKKLEIFGFKSFARKTTLHFESGVTAIVGPNGSGKSNVVDSIRWVLGEHNPRDVRAPRLEDVIFNGTDKHAPLSMAEVNLTISNEQGLLPISFSEVTITRRVYRSGESECFINQSPCRLKDIQELLLGTGLGGGTYAIIEQGHIDLVLSSKPEERRVVFEEASGVAKYLARKKETTRRLDEVEEHLVRIADIVGEVKRQVLALERQANRARQYKLQWDQLKALELKLAVDELRQGQTRYGEVEQQLQTLTTQREQLETEKQSHVASIEGLNAAVSAIQHTLQELRTAVVACASKIEQHESQLALKRRWIEELTQQAQQLEREALQWRGRIGQFDEQLARVSGGETELHTQHAAIQQQLTHGGTELSSLDATLETVLRTVDEAKAQLFDAASGATHGRNQLAEATTRLQTLEAQIGRLEAQRTQLAARAEEGRVRREASLREREVLQAQYDEVQQRGRAAQDALDAAQRRRHELTGRLHEMREQLARERAHVKLLEDLWRRYEGFPDAVKTLMERSVDGLIGPLVDLVQAAAGYEDVVEAALGPLADAIVVRDRDTLARCREALRSQQIEGCRFLVLSDCPAAPAAAQRPALEAVAGSVKEFVRTDPAYQPLVDWLLNDSWIIDDLNRVLGDGPTPEGRVISIQGDRWDRRSWRFNTAGRASGGTGRGDQEQARRLGRRQRWERAQANLASVEDAFNRADAEANTAEQEWQSILAQQESAKGQLTHLAPNLHKIEAHVNQLAQEAVRFEEEQRALEADVHESAFQREELRAALGTLQRAAEDAEVLQQTIERSLSEAQAARETAQQRKQQLLLARAQVEATFQSLAERLTALTTRRQELESDRTQLLQQIDTRATQRQEAVTRSGQLAEQLTQHEQERQRLQVERVGSEAEVERVAQALREEEAKRDQALPHLLNAEQRLSALQQEIQAHSQQLSEREFRKTRLVERLRELYHIDETTLQAEQLGSADAAPLSEEQRAEMSAQVQKLRTKLEGIGPVSLGSVEEYDELKRRLEFLQTQQQDLIQSRDDLKASIVQINRAARTQFRETFERIRQEFQTYYTRLFNGGQADLILLDEEDVLECGIDIVARPPGKRLQSISLLSGGERALTAIALLFALFKVRPSPFCILDEIDAPLDEANVDRFTRVLEEFLVLSQFILITHNKKTITKADSLYGVTMEEAGISKILSAKLGTANGGSSSGSSQPQLAAQPQ